MKNPTEQQIDAFILEIEVKEGRAGLIDTPVYHAEALLRTGDTVYTNQHLTAGSAITRCKDLVAEILEKQP